MIRMHEGKKAARFELPDGVVSREVCLESGYLASPGCSITGREIFPEGKQPKEVCPMHSGLDSPFDELRQETPPDVIPQQEEPEPSTESEIPEGTELYRPGLN